MLPREGTNGGIFFYSLVAEGCINGIRKEKDLGLLLLFTFF